MILITTWPSRTKNNNTACNVISPSATYDFEVLSSDIHFSENPADITKNVTISSRIRNKGTRDAYNVPVKYFIDDVAGRIDIATATVDIPANSTITSQVIWKASRAGSNLPVTVEVDPANAFSETSRINNKAVAPLTVNASTQPNLTTSYRDIVITPAAIHEGGSVNIQTTVRNEGFAPVASVMVHLYLGVPGADGVLIGSQTIPVLEAGSSTQVSFDWQNIAACGEKILYVQVDPHNLFSEITREDNDAFTAVTILSIPDLAISANSITFSPSAPRDGDTVAISVTVKNLGQQVANNVVVRVTESGSMIGNAVISSIAGTGQATATVSYSTAGKKGSHEIMAVVDPDQLIVERTRDNNVASRMFGVQDANLWVTERYISPNSDGIKDSTDFFFRLSLTQTVKIRVINERSDIVRTFADELLTNTSGGNVTWNGFDDEGRVVADGDYQMTIVDAGGNNIGSLTVTVDNNKSPLAKAIGTKYLLNSNLTCMLPDISQWQWFPDESGLLIKIAALNQNAPEYPAGLYAVSPDGQDILKITPWDLEAEKANNIIYDIDNYSISPDGNLLALTMHKWEWPVPWAGRLVSSRLWIMDRDGRNVKQFDSRERLTINNPLWSPDGSYLIYGVGGSDLWLIKSDGSGKMQLDAETSGSFEKLTWSPDSTKIAYMKTYYDDSITVSGISGEKQTIPWGDAGFWDQLEWLDNEKIAGAFNVFEPYFPVWIIDATGAGHHVKLTDRSSQFSISPDRAKIAYSEYAADKTYLRIAVASGNVIPVYESNKSLPYGQSTEPMETNSRYGTHTIHSMIWSPDATRIAFYDNAYEKIDDCHYKQYRAVLDWKNKSVKAFPSSTCMDLCYMNPQESYHVQIREGDNWSEKGVLHFTERFETRKLDLTPYWKSGSSSIRIRLSQKGKDVAHIDYIALDIDGVHYRPSKAVRLSDENDILAEVADRDQQVLDAYGATIDLEWEFLPSGTKMSFVLTANEETGSNKQLLKQDRKTSRYLTNHENFSGGYMACYAEGDSCANDGSFEKMQWLCDNISLLGTDAEGQFVIRSDDGKKIYLPISTVATVSPSGRYFTYDEYVEPSSACYGRGYMDVWAENSLLNLTADLLVKKEKSAVILRGIVADLNFEEYQLEYADAKNPTVWNLVKPPSNIPVVNDVFTTWVPPYVGIFYIKLTVRDKAGNVRWDRKRVTWGLTASITNLYKSLDIFSPNGDGVKDSVELHYTVLEPVHLEFNILDENHNVIRTYLTDHLVPGDHEISWDGRDGKGSIVPDGRYVLKVFDYEFFVEIDNTPPLAALSLDISQNVTVENGVKIFGPLYVDLTARVSDKNLFAGLLERGEGDNPGEWNSIGILQDDPVHRDMKVYTGKFSDSVIAGLVGQKFKVSAEDYAGNKKTTVSDFLEERLILYRWSGASSGNQSQYLEVQKTCDDDFKSKDDFHNLSKCHFFGNDPDKVYDGYEAFLAKTAELHANLTGAGVHALAVLETIRLPLVSITIQYWNGSQWIDSQVTSAPADGNVNLSWDNTGIHPDELILIRLNAVDEAGKGYYSNVIRIQPLFYLTGNCKEPDHPVYAHNNLNEKFDILKIQSSSGSVGVWMDLVTYGRASENVPEGKFPVTNLPAAKAGVSYKLRMTGTVGSGAAAVQYQSKEFIYPYDCGYPINELLVQYPAAALACNTLSAGKVSLSVRINSIKDGISLISLDYYIQKPEGSQLLRHFDLSRESVQAIFVDTSSIPAGSYPVKAVLKYRDDGEQEISVTQTMIVDHTPPRAQISYPAKSVKMCRIKQGDSGNNWYGIPVEVVAADDTNLNLVQLYYGLGDHAESLTPATTRTKSGASGSMEKRNPGELKGRLGIWDVTDLRSDVYTLTLKAFDAVGNLGCDTVSFSVDDQVDIFVSSDKRYFSPNNDGILDDVQVRYEISEYATVDVKVYKLLVQDDHNFTLDQTPVRNIAAGKTHLDGADFETWDGKDDAGTTVPDGMYGIVVQARDSCGNVNNKWVAVEVDNTHPDVDITYPRSSDPLGNIVEIRGRVDDTHFQNFTLEVGQGENPESWKARCLFRQSGEGRSGAGPVEYLWSGRRLDSPADRER